MGHNFQRILYMKARRVILMSNYGNETTTFSFSRRQSTPYPDH